MYIPPEEKATYITVATPFIGLGLLCCFSPAFRQIDVSEVIARTAILAVFSAFGLGCGIYCVSTLRNHGSYGILAGGILGILLNGGLLVFIILAVVAGLARNVN